MSFQSMVDGNNGQNQGGGYGNPTPQRGYGYQQQTSPWAQQPPAHPASPTYDAEFVHHQAHDADPFVAASAQVAIDIETLSLSYREIHGALSDINTPKDTVDFRNHLRKRIDESNALGKKVQSAIRSLASISTGSVQERRANKAKVDKMDASFTSFFSKQYGACVRQVEEQMKRYTPRTTPAGGFTTSVTSQGSGATPSHMYAGHDDEEDVHASLIEAARQQEYAQLSSDVEAQNAMIQYRDQAIRSLQRDMSEVHDMFKDLANLVSEQGHMIDDIASNVDHAAQDVDTAHVEVLKAHDYQKKSRSKLCIIAIIITIIVAIAVVAVVLAVKLSGKGNKS